MFVFSTSFKYFNVKNLYHNKLYIIFFQKNLIFKRGEIIANRTILILLLMFVVVGASLNVVSANNETDVSNDALSTIEDISPQSIEVQDNEIAESTDGPCNLTSDGRNTFEITQITYENYFNPRDGRILPDSGISSGDTIKIGNISNRAFVIDRPLTLMPITSSDKITNGFIHLVKGSDGSTVTNLTINNTKSALTFRGVTVGQLHGIWLTNSNNNLISYNTIRIADAGGVYAMPMGWSSNNRIVYNDMKTYITSVIIMGQSHYNLISHNSLEVLSYSDMSVTNLIYFNPFNHADYSGSPLCLGNVISYNYLKGFCSLPMSIILQMTYATHNGTVVANNTIIKGSFGVNLMGDNISVYGNTVNESATGISVSGSNFNVYENSVGGTSQKIGIQLSNNGGSTCSVYSNNVTFTDVVSAMSVAGNVDVYDNVISVNGYGVGISVSEEGSHVYDNRVRTNHDDGISILGSFSKVDNNIITTNSKGVSIPAKGNGMRYYNNTISRNTITSDSCGIYVTGLVYNTVMVDNVIETNSSVGIYKDITDEVSNIEEDNMVNGVILKSTAIIINDTNYYNYFDKNGDLVYKFPENKTKVIILTFLTNKNIILNEKINVISNKLSNLLFNVTITFKNNASGSLLRDFNFVNSDRKAIVIDDARDVIITKNNINEAFKKSGSDNSAILVMNACENLIISNNNLFINSKLEKAYAINANNRKTSKGLSFTNNTIIMISQDSCDAISVSSLEDVKFNSNNINIIAEGQSSGFALNGNMVNVEVLNNEIIIRSNQNATLINAYGVSNLNVCGNTLYALADDVCGISAKSSKNITIADNRLSIFTVDDGCSSISCMSDDFSINGNLIHTNVSNPILADGYFNSNSFIVDDGNYNVFFDEKGNLKSDLIGKDSTLLFANLTKNQLLNINVKVKVSSVDAGLPVTVRLTFDKNASESMVYGINFVNSKIMVNASSNIVISDNLLVNTSLNINGGRNNVFKSNNISGVCEIVLANTVSGRIMNNNFNVTAVGRVIGLENACDTLIEGNVINASSDSMSVIYSDSSIDDNILNNRINANASSIYAYNAYNSNNPEIKSNNIFIDGSGKNQAGILLTNVTNAEVFENYIISHSINGGEYAVEVISDRNLSNIIWKNYLISSNGLRYADEAVNAMFDDVGLNTPRDIFVSAEDGSDTNGDGSEKNPYASISKAVRNALNYSIIYVSGGNYSESGIMINKNLTLISLNPGKTLIDACASQLFNISENSTFSISGFSIRNAHNVDGGSAFANNGKLIINDTVISDSSSFFDNSHPVFDHDISYSDDGDLKEAYTVDCRKTGMGGAILNNGELQINSSAFFNNLGHYGGAIANFGKTSIESSAFYSNLGVHGGAIYSNTTSPMDIKNTEFNNNVAITSIDYCAIRLYTTGWSIDEGNRHQTGSYCDLPLGMGGAIYANNGMNIENSKFISNSARMGGAIAAYGLPDLEVKNSTFMNNRANDTRRSIGENDLDYFGYNSGHEGGAVWGNFNKLHVLESEFYFNQAIRDGGAIHATAKDGRIIDSVLMYNTAGVSGGALDVSDNFIIMRSVISNNSASYGGAIEYTSSVYYGHIQNNLNIYNSTISGNKALDRGGAFNFGSGNITIRDSNIVGNFAPSGNTIGSSGGTNAFDMRYNYWGKTSSGYSGPDDSVWSVNNNQFKPWYGQWVKWEGTVVDGNPSSGSDDEGKENPNPIINPKPEDEGSHSSSTGTGSSASTGTNIGGRGNWQYSGNGDGSNMGYQGIGNNHNGLLSSLNGRQYSGQNIVGSANTGNSSSSHESNANGNVNSDSLSKSNSSSYNPNFASVGMVANAASSDSSSQGGSQGEGGSQSSDVSQSVSKAFEISEFEDLANNGDSMVKFLVFAFITLSLLIIGYRRSEDEKEEY